MSINNTSIHECFDDYKSRETSIAIEILEQGVEKFKVAMDFKVDPRAQRILHVYIVHLFNIIDAVTFKWSLLFRRGAFCAQFLQVNAKGDLSTLQKQATEEIINDMSIKSREWNSFLNLFTNRQDGFWVSYQEHN